MRILRILILPLVTCLVSGQLTRMMKRFFVSMNDRISPEFNDEVTSLREEQRGMPDQQRLTLRASQFDRIDDSIKESIRTTAETEEDNSFAGFPFYDQSTEPDDSEDDEFDQIGNNLGHPDPIEDITIPKDDEDEIFQSPIAVPSDHMFSLKIIPNLTTRKDLFNEMTSAALRNRQAVKFGFPIKELINATLNKGPFPTLVPHQVLLFNFYSCSHNLSFLDIPPSNTSLPLMIHNFLRPSISLRLNNSHPSNAIFSVTPP